MEPFSFTRQTAVFLGVLATLELVVVLVFPMLAALFGVLSLFVLLAVWAKSGIRTGRWLWWNPASVPLSSAEGAIAVSAALLLAVGLMVVGYEGARIATGKRDLFVGPVWEFMRPAGLSPRPAVGTRATHYSDAEMQQHFKDELTKAGIPYKLEAQEGKEFVRWTEEYNKAVEEIVRKLQEGPSPTRRNTSFDSAATQQEFKDWLVKRGIAFEISTVRGREFVTWKDGPADLAMQFMMERARSISCPVKGAARPDADAAHRC